jgi:hypothetical protein
MYFRLHSYWVKSTFTLRLIDKMNEMLVYWMNLFTTNTSVSDCVPNIRFATRCHSWNWQWHEINIEKWHNDVYIHKSGREILIIFYM